MKRKLKKLTLSKETVRTLDLRQVVGGETMLHCVDTEGSRCATDCATCGATNYNTCYSCDTLCFGIC
jgi:hypothetical protein